LTRRPPLRHKSRMAEPPSETQRIERLMPLAEAQASIDRLVCAHPMSIGPVSPHRAYGLTLAVDATAPNAYPDGARALRDGAAVRAEATLDASSYAPVRIEAVAVEVGDPMPVGTDAVAPAEMLESRGDAVYALAPLAPGDGVLPDGADVGRDDLLYPAGTHIGATHIAVLSALDYGMLLTHPSEVCVASAHPKGDRVVAAIQDLLVSAIRGTGAEAFKPSPDLIGLDAVRAAGTALIVVGGSGPGPRDRSVRDLAERGRLAFHGVAMAPGETAAFGMIRDKPVLIVPARIDAALAVWITLGRRMLARQVGRNDTEAWSASVTLKRKIVSTLGIVELVAVAREQDGVIPLASGYLPPQALARSNGYVLVPAESEGFAAGSRVEMRPWP
jgi:molybdopterin molybdotransferase